MTVTVNVVVVGVNTVEVDVAALVVVEIQVVETPVVPPETVVVHAGFGIATCARAINVPSWLIHGET